jgi:lipid-A-disaccharide synthase
LGLGDAPVLLALPGSRRGEVERLTPVFGAALGLFLARHPDMRVVIPAAAPVAEQVRAAVADWPGSPRVIDPAQYPAQEAAAHKRAAFYTAELALAASGTVSLELAAAETPMVIAYNLNWLTTQIAKRMVNLDTVTLVNLVSDTRTVPERLLDDCTPEQIAEALEEVAADPQRQRAAMDQTMQQLGRGGENPGLRAARAVLARMGSDG